MPVDLRGGPPERAEEEAGSSSDSFPAKFIWHEKMLLPAVQGVQMQAK